MAAPRSPRGEFCLRTRAFKTRLAARSFLFLITTLFFPTAVSAQEAYRSPRELKKLSLEELIYTQITSASRRPEPLSQASSAIDVITSDEILRSGVTNIPDALRLATGMHVAQVDGHTWAISARGFNISTANKMQVVMDGRSLYTPLYSGVFWDVQHAFLPDLEQIEVVRGPGAALWGANAVNGVINIRTKSAKDTQGTLVYGGGGNEEHGMGGVRYGGKIGKNSYARVYIMHQSRDSLTLEGGGDAQDATSFTKGGFRFDSELSRHDTLTFQGDIYTGRFGRLNSGDVEAEGFNTIARWSRHFDEDSNFSLQAYFDRTDRLIPRLFEEERNTYDLELEHRFRMGERHEIIYGANYRVSDDDLGNLDPSLAFLPASQTNHLLSAYVQDTFDVIPEKLSLTAGSKFEWNSFSGFEVQPTGRFTWNPASNQTVWGAISRAVRTPTRLDQDVVLPNPSSGASPAFVGSPDFDSEELIAYELGYRVKPITSLSLDVVLYYHDYHNIRSLERQGVGLPIEIANGLEGESYGGSLTAKWRATEWWQLHASLSVFETDIRRVPGSTDISNGAMEGNDPNQLLVLRSAMDLPGNVKFDSTVRFVGELPNPATPSYVELDLRIAWSPLDQLEVALVGRNLLDEGHPEFRGSTNSREIPRSLFGTFRWSF